MPPNTLSQTQPTLLTVEDRLQFALTAAGDICVRLQNATDRLYGTRPEAAEQEGKPSLPNGLVETWHSQLDRLAQLHQRAELLCARFEEA
jgi:uncharacterized protein YciW